MADLSESVRVGAWRMGESLGSDFRTWWREVRDLAMESRVEDLAAAVYWTKKGQDLVRELCIEETDVWCVHVWNWVWWRLSVMMYVVVRLYVGPPQNALENVGEHTNALAYVPSTPNSGTGGFGSIETAAA